MKIDVSRLHRDGRVARFTCATRDTRDCEATPCTVGKWYLPPQGS